MWFGCKRDRSRRREEYAKSGKAAIVIGHAAKRRPGFERLSNHGRILAGDGRHYEGSVVQPSSEISNMFGKRIGILPGKAQEESCSRLALVTA